MELQHDPQSQTGFLFAGVSKRNKFKKILVIFCGKQLNHAMSIKLGRSVMLSQITLLKTPDRQFSFVRCHWCHKFLKSGNPAVMDEYREIYCNDNCFNDEVDDELKFHERKPIKIK